jgi:hypothetical protein
MLESSATAPDQSRHAIVTECRLTVFRECRTKNNLLQGSAVLTEGYETRIGDLVVPTEIHQLIYEDMSEKMRGDGMRDEG